MEIMQANELIEAMKEALRAERNNKVQLLTVEEVATKLRISSDYLKRVVMHRQGFPKPMRLTTKGDLKFLESDIDTFILNLQKERA